jgi:P pilus assembly chaperone PapD
MAPRHGRRHAHRLATAGSPHFFFALSLSLTLALAGSPVSAQVAAQVWPSKVSREVDPGKPIAQEVLITNRSDMAAVVRVRTADWTLSRNGDLQLLPFGVSPHSLAGCMTFFPESFSLAPGESRTVNVTVTLPPDGETTRWGLLLQEVRPAIPYRSSGPKAIAEIGTTFYVSRSHESEARAELTALDVTPDGPDSMRVRITLQNQGLRHCYARGDIQLADEHGVVLRTGSVAQGVILPASAREFSWKCAGRLPSGHYRVTASLDTGNPYLLVGEKSFAWPAPAPDFSWLGFLHL